MKDAVLVTFTGSSKWATLNGMWALVEQGGLLPSKVIVLHTSPITDDSADARRLIERFVSTLDDCQLVDISLPTDDVSFMRERLEKIIEVELEDGNRVFVDMTPARKLMALALMASPWIRKVERLSYLHVDNLENADRPYPMIPFKRQQLLTLEVPE